jgi:energy-coupling factor transport system ATP-binding protein
VISLAGLTLQREGPDGPVTVIEDLELTVAEGERVALLGGNGSGKSTLLRHLARPGVVADRRGGLLCQDPDEQLVAATVANELTFGHADLDPQPWLKEFGLDGLDDIDPQLLSAGQKQRLQLATVLSHAPDLLLLDEPGSLQDAAQTAWLRQRLDGWPGTMIWATQDPAEARTCGRAMILERGRVVTEGATPEVLATRAAAALWEEMAPRPPTGPNAAAGVAVSLEHVAVPFHRGRLGPLTLTIAPGRRLGITGPNGCGKSTLLAVIAGLRRPERGTVHVAGRRLYRDGRQDLGHALVSLAPQFPEYFFATGSVADESRLGGLDPEEVLAAAGLLAHGVDRAPHDLSGGERRRLALSLVLGAERPVILLDEPTAALDAAGRRAVHAQIDRLDHGTTLIVASHDLGFLRACGCDVRELSPEGLVPVEA